MDWRFGEGEFGNFLNACDRSGKMFLLMRLDAFGSKQPLAIFTRSPTEIEQNGLLLSS